MSDQNEITEIKKLTKEIRKNILKLSLAAGASSSHFGGALSIVEIVSTLFVTQMKIDSSNPNYGKRIRFSKSIICWSCRC